MEPKLFRERTLYRVYTWPHRALIMSSALYAISTLFVDLVPFLVVYGFNYEGPRGGLPYFRDIPYPDMRKAFMWRCILYWLLLIPSFCLLAKVQAQLISPKEITVVLFQKNNHRPGFRSACSRTNFVRIIRMLIQSIVVSVVFAGICFVWGRFRFQDLSHADMLEKWIYRHYLDPRNDFQLFGTMDKTAFWYWNLLFLLNPWKQALPFSRGYEHWMKFGPSSD